MTRRALAPMLLAGALVLAGCGTVDRFRAVVVASHPTSWAASLRSRPRRRRSG